MGKLQLASRKRITLAVQAAKFDFLTLDAVYIREQGTLALARARMLKDNSRESNAFVDCLSDLISGRVMLSTDEIYAVRRQQGRVAQR